MVDPMVLFRLMTVVGVLSALAMPAFAASASKGLEITFDVSARDSHIGQGALLIGPKGNANQPLRAVKLSGKTTSILGILYNGMLEATSWLDAGCLPVQVQWQSKIGGNKALTQGKFDGKHVQAVFSRPGQRDVAVDKTVDDTLLDPVALVPWLMQQKPKPGKKLQTHLYTGMDVCQANLEVGAAESILVAGQSREALPLTAQLQGCRLDRKFTIWLAPRDMMPLKLAIFDKLLGTIDFELAGIKAVAMVAPPPPSSLDDGPPLPHQADAADKSR